MIEAGVVVVGPGSDVVFWHSPPGRTGGSLPDSRTLWEVLEDYRKAPGLGFAHSHPGGGVPGPSHEDVTTFSAVERGLGRRLLWWITSSEHTVLTWWEGPGKYDYKSMQVKDPWWAAELRSRSEQVDER